MPFGFAAKFCEEWARVSLWAFFSDIKIENAENTVADQSAATHHNMLLDPAILCHACSSQHLHYWAKSSIFANKYARLFLNSVGCVPVDRDSKEHDTLYKSTFDVLELNESIAIFPEGTSHTLPRLSKLKDGTSFVALEYAKSLKDTFRLNRYGSRPKAAVIVPVGIVYTDKSQFRSKVIVRFGEPINVEHYLIDFEQDPKATAKRVTKELENSLLKLTINSPDWPNRHSALMAREMLFPGENNENMSDFVQVTQSLINIFVELDSLKPLVEHLYTYRRELQDLEIRDNDLLAFINNEKNYISPNQVIKGFAKESLIALVHLPLLLPVLLVHFPLYMISRHYARIEQYEEVRAQSKILYATMVLPLIYFVFFFWEWYYLYSLSFFGFFFSIVTLFIFFWLHVESSDSGYGIFKQWRASYHLFDAFILNKGCGYRKERFLEVTKLRKFIQEQLYEMLNSDTNDSNTDIQNIKRAIKKRIS